MTITQIRSTDGTGSLAYIVSDESTRTAAIIDPNIEDLKNIQLCAIERGVQITHIIDTHTHADHISGAEELKKLFNAKILMHEETKNKWKVLKNAEKFGIEEILNKNASVKVDEYVNDGDIIKIGQLELKVLHTPGHTDNHITIHTDEAIFTGDLLLIGQAGRSDLPGGNPADQYDSLYKKIIPLPGNTKIYPGHDYENNEFAYLRYELESNPFLQQKSKEDYIKFVKDFFPPFAESMGPDGKVSLQCGATRIVQKDEKIKSINAEELSEKLKEDDLFLLDVREPFELLRGAVPGVVNIPLKQLPQRVSELPEDKSKPIVAICASGNRSLEASHFLSKNGYTNVLNLSGGTIAWLKKGLETVK